MPLLYSPLGKPIRTEASRDGQRIQRMYLH